MTAKLALRRVWREIIMLTPLRLVVLLVIAAVGPYVVSETDMGRSAFTRFTNLFRSSGQKRSVDGQETYVSTDWSRAQSCLLYTSPSPRDATLSRMPSSA